MTYTEVQLPTSAFSQPTAQLVQVVAAYHQWALKTLLTLPFSSSAAFCTTIWILFASVVLTRPSAWLVQLMVQGFSFSMALVIQGLAWPWPSCPGSHGLQGLMCQRVLHCQSPHGQGFMRHRIHGQWLMARACMTSDMHKDGQTSWLRAVKQKHTAYNS